MSWFLLYSFLPFALYSGAMVFYSLGEVEISRSLPKSEYNAGEPLKVDVTIRRRSSFPLFYLFVEDELNEPLKFSNKKNKAKILLFPGFKKEFSFKYIVEELPRGEHFFHFFKLRTGDPLGLMEIGEKVEAENRIIVYPAFSELIYQPFENHYDQGMTVSRERVQRDSTMAIGVREYQPGDRFSWINWKATAKRNEIMTKEFEQRQSHDVFVVMDCLPDRRFETVVSFTASLIRAVLRKGAQTGLLTNSRERSSFPLRGGEKQMQELFYHLAKIQPYHSSLEKVMEAELFLAQQSISLMLVTSKISKELIDKAAAFGQRKGSVTIFLIKDAKESPDKSEISLKAMANARGVRMVLVHDGQFAAAFSEVNLR
ncbi:DUF58 domain-containing protein [Neobacillus sp. PS3-34]|uniref:DUF58 domain-containing protein n=1 Tax=Neobacillus sp. PS3-34 TaxID=3070678 RepID=UPI0027E163D2|nr:DUF58 domain-containing protein [Neobacillus sp. PS3-34]WML50153.1 DUF58 domain-containing protein [Neobacillus sp. PS3-34]